MDISPFLLCVVISLSRILKTVKVSRKHSVNLLMELSSATRGSALRPMEECLCIQPIGFSDPERTRFYFDMWLVIPSHLLSLIRVESKSKQDYLHLHSLVCVLQLVSSFTATGYILL